MTGMIDTTHPYFGGCPICHKHNGFLHIGRGDTWFVCDEHRTKYACGGELDGWRWMSEAEFEHNRKLLEAYTEVEPWVPTNEEIEGYWADQQSKQQEDGRPSSATPESPTDAELDAFLRACADRGKQE